MLKQYRVLKLVDEELFRFQKRVFWGIWKNCHPDGNVYKGSAANECYIRDRDVALQKLRKLNTPPEKQYWEPQNWL